MAARAGQAQVLVALGRYSEAATIAAQVPDDFLYTASYTDQDVSNLWAETQDQTQATVWNTPIADLETHLESHPTHLLVVSSKSPPDPAEFDRQIAHLAGFERLVWSAADQRRFDERLAALRAGDGAGASAAEAD